MFTNKAFVDDQNRPSASYIQDDEFLRTRNHNTGHPQNNTVNNMLQELEAAKLKNKNHDLTKALGIPEGLKGRRYKDLTRKEIKELGEINAAQERFRHRYSEEDYRNDIDRGMAGNIRWLD